MGHASAAGPTVRDVWGAGCRLAGEALLGWGKHQRLLHRCMHAVGEGCIRRGLLQGLHMLAAASFACCFNHGH